MRKFIPTVGILLVLIVAVSSLWRYLDQPVFEAPAPFPDKLTQRVHLPPDSRSEDNRIVSYQEDGFTVNRISVDARDGTSGYAIYRDDGVTLHRVYMFYPPVGDAPAAKKMESVYQDNGVHLESEKHFYEDGSLKRTGKRLASGNYLVYDFEAGESHPKAETVFNLAGTAFNTVKRHANGNFAELAITDGGVTEITTFHENGLKATYYKAVYSNKLWEKYKSDGETLEEKFELKASGDHHGMSYEMHGTYFNEDGTVNHTREFSRYYQLVRFFDEDGNFTHSQRWNHYKPYNEVESVAHDQWFLIQVGLSENLSIDDSFHFSKDGKIEKYLKKVLDGNGDVKLETREYYPDGTLKLYRRPDPDNPGGKFLSTAYKPGESSETFDMSLIEGKTDIFPYTVPPELPPLIEYGGYP